MDCEELHNRMFAVHIPWPAEETVSVFRSSQIYLTAAPGPCQGTWKSATGNQLASSVWTMFCWDPGIVSLERDVIEFEPIRKMTQDFSVPIFIWGTIFHSISIEGVHNSLVI